MSNTAPDSNGVNRIASGVSGGGQFAFAHRDEPQPARGIPLIAGRPTTDAEVTLSTAHRALLEERERFNTESSVLMLDEQLSVLALRGDRVRTITGQRAEPLAGNPVWDVTTMTTADGRNLVTGHHMDINLPESRIMSVLECMDDEESHSWINADAGTGEFTIDAERIGDSARALGVPDNEPPRSEQRKALTQAIVARRELAGSEYTLAAAAVISERITKEHPDAATLRFRYQDGALKAHSLVDRIGRPIKTDQAKISSTLNQDLDYSDLCASPIDRDTPEKWFNKQYRLPFSWEWDLAEVDDTAARYL